jgi:hypothetical protein
MQIVDEVVRFFLGLFRNRVDNVEIAARSRLMSAEAKLKSRVANQVNQRIDGAIDRGRQAVGVAPSPSGTPPQGRQPHPAAAKKA